MRDGQTNKRQAKIELLSFWSVNRWVSQLLPGLWIENINIYVNQHNMISLNPYIHVFIICIPAWPDFVYWQYIIHFVQVESTDRVAEAKEEPIEVEVEEEAPVATADDVSEPEQKVQTKPGLWRENIFQDIS